MMEKESLHLNYKNNELHIRDMSITELTHQRKTPFYLYDRESILENYHRYTKSSKDNQLNSVICFALKSNNNIELLRSLAQAGCGADIVSSGELHRAVEAGVDPNKIVFSGVGKTQEDIELGLKHKIYSFNVESISELELIGKIAKEQNTQAQVAFRLNPKVHAKTHKHISTGFKTHKFGLLKEDILTAVNTKTLWENVKLIGLSVHIGSQLKCLDATKTAVEELCSVAEEIETKLEFLDVGGGLGVNYKEDDEIQAPSIEEYVKEISLIIGPRFPDITTIFEPGRSISASSGFLVTKVIRSKKSEEHNFLIVDGGMNDFVRPSLYQAYHEIYPGKLSGEKITTDIVGPICETADCFGEKRELPPLAEGDFIVISHAGAYGRTMSSHYNMRELPKEYLLK